MSESGWPFLIEDATPRSLRVPHEPAQTRHADGALGIAGVTVLARDDATLTREYESILKATAEAWKPGAARQVAGSMLHLGSTRILLTEPHSPEERQHVARHGQGPFRIILRCHDGPIGPEEGSLIDPTLMTGAKFLLA